MKPLIWIDPEMLSVGFSGITGQRQRRRAVFLLQGKIDVIPCGIFPINGRAGHLRHRPVSAGNNPTPFIPPQLRQIAEQCQGHAGNAGFLLQFSGCGLFDGLLLAAKPAWQRQLSLLRPLLSLDQQHRKGGGGELAVALGLRFSNGKYHNIRRNRRLFKIFDTI